MSNNAYKNIEYATWSHFSPNCLWSVCQLDLRDLREIGEENYLTQICCSRSTTSLFIRSFISTTLFFFFLSFWIHLWLSETQQPISQTIWRSPPIVRLSVTSNHCVCDQCPGEDEHVQNEVHALLICQDHRVCELRKHFSFLFSPFFEDLSAAQPFLLQQVNNQLVHVFLSQQNNRLFYFFLSFWIHFWLSETSQQPNNLEGHPPNLCWSVTSVAIVCPLSQFVSPVENKTMSRKLSFSQYKHLVNK